MGYGGGIALVALGLILALAVNEETAGPFDVQMIGWIVALAGLVWIVIRVVQANTRRTRETVARTIHPDGSQTVHQRTTSQEEPPPPAI